MTVAGTDARFRLLPPERPARELEEELLARWTAERLFERSLERRAGGDKPPFVFFEGPPTANGRPGIHHVFSRTIKDLFCRHRAMRGHHVPRKAGWDTHGLPVEIEVEKQLAERLVQERGLDPEAVRRASGKQLIELYGVEAFNRLCRESVFTYRGEWEQLSTRIGYWLDYTRPYITYSNDYVESVWWALASLHQRDLLYRGHKILPYCARCGTALSSHELALGYQEDVDPSIYVALDLEDRSPGGVRRRILVWTTTPWTLVSNVALAVHPDLDYVELRKRSGTDGTIVLAAARAPAVLGDDYADRWETVARFTGAALVGSRYRRPLDWVSLAGVSGEHEVIVGESFVSSEDGTGVVHMAPAFGVDDYAAGQRHGLAFLQPINARGEFPADMPRIGGRFAKAADAEIIDELARRDVLWKAGTLTHQYPHCWRCGTPLLYYARQSWFIRTTAYRDRMLARNARVDWHPAETGEKKFGNWLVNNIDWAISRDRYWGTPLPVWVCDADPTHVEVLGSYAELAAKVGGTTDGRDAVATLGADFDPHKPFIDRYAWPCPECAGTSDIATSGHRDSGAPEKAVAPSPDVPTPDGPMMRRVPEVIDAWFDSGSMPFAQWHFPFENRATLEQQYPADFIAEGVDQTRGWFYSLLAIATGLGDALPNNLDPGTSDAGAAGSRASGHEVAAPSAAPYRAVVVNDHVLDANGIKMSKSRGNVVDPWDVITKYGADAVRLFLVAASQIDVPRRFDEQAIRETAARFLLTLKNVYSGVFACYANFGWEPSDADPPVAERPAIDRWVLSRLANVEREVDALFGAFDATAAARRIMTFVVDDVSNWYVRQTRRRFYDTESDDNRAAFATLHEVLVVVSRLLAPVSPFVSDWLHRELTLTGESVHLAPFVRAGEQSTDPLLEDAMAEIRRLSTLGRAAREDAGIHVRQPLARLECIVPSRLAAAVDPLFPLLAVELNVKQIRLATSADALVTLEAKPNFRALGKRFGKDTPLAAQAVAALPSDVLRAFEHGEPVAISVGNESRLLHADDLTIVRRAAGNLLVKEDEGRFVAIDPTITPELRLEGLARELVSRVQRLRKEAGLAVSDRVQLWVSGTEEIVTAVRVYHDWIANEVLARVVHIGDDAPSGDHTWAQTMEIDGISVRVAITRED